MSGAFLGVEASATGRRWAGLAPDLDRAALALAQVAGLPEPVARVLARQRVTPAEARRYLAPSLRDLMPDPSVLRDMDAAAERLARAVRAGERIAVFADYDVDGACSAALLLDWLAAQGRAATLYVPDRIDEGYGPNPAAMAELARGHTLIVCVDCGTAAGEAVAAAADADVVVLDHHLAGETLPDALVVNPNRADEAPGLGHLCAAGVVFLALVAANRCLRRDGLAPPDLLGLLDLVALATIADVSPLRGLNRAFVRQGLKVMAARGRPGLVALADGARLTAAPGVYQLGYVLGPRINAGGRVGRADLGARLLTERDPAAAARFAASLEAFNRERQAIEASVLAAARAAAEANGTDGPLVWAAGEGWHPGVVGIVAARLREAFDRPALVIGLDGAEGKGSGRSAPGIDLGRAVARLAAEGLIQKGGGHPMAAGLTVARDRLGAAMARLSDLVAAEGPPDAGRGDLRIDGLLAPDAAVPALLALIEEAGPFGAGASAPRYAFAGVRLAWARPVGTGHLAFACTDAAGARLEGIAFRAGDGPLGPFLAGLGGRRAHLAGRLELDRWGGRERVKLHLDDAAPAD